MGPWWEICAQIITLLILLLRYLLPRLVRTPVFNLLPCESLNSSKLTTSSPSSHRNQSPQPRDLRFDAPNHVEGACLHRCQCPSPQGVFGLRVSHPSMGVMFRTLIFMFLLFFSDPQSEQSTMKGNFIVDSFLAAVLLHSSPFLVNSNGIMQFYLAFCVN